MLKLLCSNKSQRWGATAAPAAASAFHSAELKNESTDKGGTGLDVAICC